MPSTRELRRRIRSVKNTAQITKAMQMVAATKMRKAQLRAMAGRPYLQALQISLSRLLEGIDLSKYPLLVPSASTKTGILLLSTDKSLCGALNTNLWRFTQQFIQEKSEPIFYSMGRKGREYIVKTGKNLTSDFENKDLVTFSESVNLAAILSRSFLAGELKEAYVIYPHFVSALTQEPKALKLLPIDQGIIEANKAEVLSGQPNGEYLIEPDKESLLGYVLKHFVETSVYQTILETKASEHSARMMSMQNATDNAKELASDLQLTYNQTRQAAITNELLEITSAAAALE